MRHSATRGRGGDIAMKRMAIPLAAAAFVAIVALAMGVAAAPDPPEAGPALPPPPGPDATGEGGATPPAQNELAFDFYRAAGGEGGATPPAQNELAFDFYRAAGGEGGSNVFFSPPSIHTAFSILYEGAGGRTALQMSDALGISPDADARWGDASRAASALAGSGDAPAVTALANALWIDDGFTLYDSYRGVARGAYGASIDTVDFSEAAGAARQINGRVSGSTNGLIKEAISADSLGDASAMVIASAAYFRGEWALPFPAHATREGPFTREDGSSARADFMTVRGGFDHVAYDGYQVLRIPYKGDRLSMLVVLPDGAASLGGVAGGLSAGASAAWLGDMEERKLLVTIPKFTVETRYDLGRILGAMGVTDAFDKDAADLEGIGFHEEGGTLHVGSAAHAAHVSVDEVGTEAAAATVIELELVSRPPSFVADRPFMFLVHDAESGTILFMGSVADPSRADPR